MPRVGSEYQDPEDPVDRQILRERFLALVAQLRPDALESLRKTVLPVYANAVTSEVDLPAPWPTAKHLDEWRNADPSRDDGENRLGVALLGWGERFHLTGDWLLRTAFATVRWWYEQIQGGKSSIPGSPAILNPNPDQTGFRPVVWNPRASRRDFAVREFTFSHRPWAPFWEPSADFEQTLKRSFDEAVRTYMNQCHAGMNDLGLTRSPEIRGGADRDLTRLIRSRVPPTETLAEIALSEPRRKGAVNKAAEEEDFPYLTTISRAIKKMEARVGLDSRT